MKHIIVYLQYLIFDYYLGESLRVYTTLVTVHNFEYFLFIVLTSQIITLIISF